MRVSTKNASVGNALLRELRERGVSFELRKRPSHETFVGYVVEGTLEEIRAKLGVIDGVDKDVLIKGFNSFKEGVLHVAEHLKKGISPEALFSEGSWTADVVDQLYRAGVVEYSGDILKLKEGTDVASIKLLFKFPFELVHDPEKAEKIAKQFVFTDLVTEWEFEIEELHIEKINSFGEAAGRYLPENEVLQAYFGLIGRAILAGEMLKAIGDKKMNLEDLKKSFVRAMPIEIPTERGTLVINASPEFITDLLNFLEKRGYVDIKAGKVKKIRDL